MGTESNKIIVILGMHRSGTSAVARGLGVLGVNLGDNLYPAAMDNPKGFWEDRDILAINEELLAYIGSDYDRLGLINWEMSNDPAIELIKLKAIQLVHEKCVKDTLWGFKDPRTSRLLSFWQAVFGDLEADVCYLIVVRNPISVVESLRKRNGFEPEKSFYLWLEHLVPAIQRTKGKTRVVIDYDHLLENTGPELLRVAKALSLPTPDPSAIAAYENDFLEKGLRHTHFTNQDVSLYPAVPLQVIAANNWLIKLAQDNISLDSQEVEQAFDVLSLELFALYPALNFIAHQELKIAEMQRIICYQDSRINEIYTSRSWRLTRPLRLFERIIRMGFGKAAVKNEQTTRQFAEVDESIK